MLSIVGKAFEKHGPTTIEGYLGKDPGIQILAKILLWLQIV